jgi:O-antigen ligase
VGIFANPNEVAYSLVILVPLAAYLATPKGWARRLILLAISILFAAAIYVTFSRGGLIGLVAVIALYAWRKRNLWFQGLALLLLVAGLAFASRFWSRGEDFSQLDSDVSLQQRIATSQAGINMFFDHPLLGVGFGCSVVAWPLYAPTGLYARGALVTHNTFIQLLSETGILGFLPFVLLIGFSLYHARKLALQPATANSGAAIEVALWGLVVCGMSGGYVLTWFPYLFLGLAAAARRIPEQSL